MLAVTFAPDGPPTGLGEAHDGLQIAGSIRLDARDALMASLGLAGQTPGDAVLCVQAYRRWGDAFVDRLAGDFAFALWDATRRRLLLVRDQLGIRSLFYARIGMLWCVSDSLEALAARPGFDKHLDETWIGDFLATNHSLDDWRTVYAAARRVPPAHCVALTRDGETSRRYWRLTVAEPLFLRDGRAYGEQFRALTKAAIHDRVPEGRVGISMSGGLDSTTLAALSVEELGGPSRVTARCNYFQSLMADDEPVFARLTAGMLGIELGLEPTDSVYDPQWRERGLRTAEPTHTIVNAHRDQALVCRMAATAAVWFYGEGPDNALEFEREAYLGWLLRTGRWGRAVSASWQYLRIRRAERALPPSPFADPPADRPETPAWMRADFVERIGLRERLSTFFSPPPHDHPWHPRALGSFGTPAWHSLLGMLEADRALGLDWRHPYLDLRVLQFLLSVPPVPWARRKLVMREAMRGRLPAEVLARRKTPLVGNALQRALSAIDLPPLRSSAQWHQWIDPGQLPRRPQAAEIEPLLAAHALDHWLT